MDDKTIMDNILSVTKGACDLMMHGAIESSTPDVHMAFKRAGTRRSRRNSRRLTPRSKNFQTNKK